MTSPSIQFSVVIPTYLRPAQIVETVKYYLREETPLFELIVIDQSAVFNNELLKLSEELPLDKLRYFHLPGSSLPRARNEGIIRTRGEIVFFSDDDVLPEPGILSAHWDCYQNPAIAGVGGRLVHPEGVAHSYPYVCRINWLTGDVRCDFDHSQEEIVLSLPGGNMSFRRSALLKVGGFDSHFGGSAHLEETDLCLRLVGQGYRLLFNPRAELFHQRMSEGGCRTKNWAEWFFWDFHNHARLFRRHFPKLFLPFFLCRSLLRLIKAGFLYREKKICSQGLKGLWRGWWSNQLIYGIEKRD